MKTSFLISFIFLVLAGAQAQSRIVALISNARSDNGVCRICLFDNMAAFTGSGGKPLQCVQALVKSGTAEGYFENVKAGTYAVAVFHDANNNNKMDKNFLGIPKEGYGASQNNLPFASAPGFDENKFTIPDKSTTTLRIRLRNL